MSTDTLQDFVQARLRAFDPTIDLSDGSPAQDQVVDPIVRRFQPDPFEMSIETFIDARLKQEIPTMSIQEGTGVRDLLVKPAQVLMDPVSREVQLIKQGQSLANPDLLADTEADALVANFFVSRNLGSLAVGRVRLFFNAPIAINVSVGNVCYTAGGLRFLPTTIQSISAEAMVFNQTGSLFYFDIKVTAESPGEQYNIDPQAITGITNLNVAVRATNLSKFEKGLDQETTTDLIQRASDSITERSLVVPRGVTARLFDQFNDLEQLQIIGMFDPEMHRDVLTGGDLGIPIATGNDGYVEDDGLGGVTTTRFRTYLDHNLSQAFSTGPIEDTYLLTNEMAFGIDGVIATPYFSRLISASAVFTSDDVGRLISIRGGSNNGIYKIDSVVSPTTVTLVDPLTELYFVGVAETGITWVLLRTQRQTQIASFDAGSPTELKLATPIPLTANQMSWTIRKKELTISGIPGGIIFSADAQAVSIQSDQVHIGGCTDFYVRGAGTQTLDLNLSAIEDEEPLVTSAKGTTNGVGGGAGSWYFQDQFVDFVAAGVTAGMSLVTFLGTDAGTRRIVRVGISSTGSPDAHSIQVDSQFSNDLTECVQYAIVGNLTIDLINPKTIRDTGLHGRTIQLGQVFTTSDLVDFLAFGTEVGDTLRILTGQDAGDYSITAITGTGHRNLSLSRFTTTTATELSWQVFKAQTGIQLPMIKIDSVSLLDSSGNPTGSIIPRADPVDARSTTFSNAGNGVKFSITDGILGIVGQVDLNTLSYPLAPCSIDVVWTSSTGTQSAHVVLNGCANPGAVLQVINTATPHLAGTLSGDNGERYLTLRSSDSWVRIITTAGVSLGLTGGEDNRQIRHAADLAFPWEDSEYDLRPALDVVSVTSGLNVGNYYLVVIDDVNHRIMVTGFDETTGTVRFLQPDMGVELSVGSRSTGTARVYFLDPTSFEVHGAYRPALKSTSTCPANAAAVGTSINGGPIAEGEPAVTRFTAMINGVGLGFVPDPALKHTLIPEAGNTVIPNNLTINSGPHSGYATSEVFASSLGYDNRSPVIDFVAMGVQVGDLIQITYQPLQGNADIGALLAGTPNALVNHTLILKVDDKKTTITFSVNAITTDVVASEINRAVGVDVAFITNYSSSQYLMIEADVPIVILTTGTANSILGFTPPPGQTTLSNESFFHQSNTQGLYKVVSLNANPYDPTSGFQIEIQDMEGNPPLVPTTGYYEQANHFQVLRQGVQRISSTEMNKRVESGLHYVDIELISDGSGDLWNIPEGLVFIITGHTSDGYRLVVADTNLSYSIEEQLSMVLTPSMLEVGATDSVENEIQLAGQNIQIEYEQAGIVADIQSFASSDLDRVLTASILVRHLFPTYINFDMNYIGGSSSDVVTADVLAYLDALTPNERVESSSIQDKAMRRGALSVTNPITLLAVAHDEARQISVDRSYDSVSKGKLSTFFEGVINIKQQSSS